MQITLETQRKQPQHKPEDLLLSSPRELMPSKPCVNDAGAVTFQSVSLCSVATCSHREGYNNPQVSGENLIGLSRARRPHNAIFVNFDDEEIPAKPLDAAVQTWKKVCTNPVDKKVEEELGKVRALLLIWAEHYTVACRPHQKLLWFSLKSVLSRFGM
ncbi:uncharacterized protein J5F26_013292 isoform 2-T2 [Ciconia maguari]